MINQPVTTSKLNGSLILQIREVCLFRRQAGERVQILNTSTQQIYQLLNIAAYLWLQLDGSQTLQEVVDSAQRDFSLSAEDVPRLYRYFEELFTQNLVKVREDKDKAGASRSWIKRENVNPIHFSSFDQVRPLGSLYAAGGGSGSGGSGASSSGSTGCA